MASDFFKRLQTKGIQDLQNKSKNIAQKMSYEEQEENTTQDLMHNNPQDINMMQNQDMQMPPNQPMEDTHDSIEELNDYTETPPQQNPATLAAMTMATKNTKKSTRNSSSEEGQLTVDVYETHKAIVVKSVVAGVSTNDLKITITPEYVSISGERRHEETVDKDAYFYQECFWGSFSRSISLPTEIDPEDAKASISKGVLTIVLPKLERKGEKTLEIEEI